MSTVVLSIAILGIYGAALGAIAIATAIHAPALIELPVAAAILLVVYGWRWIRIGVVGTEDVLVVRNPLVTRTIRRTAVRAFVIGGSRWAFPSRAIRVVLDDQSTLVLMATDGGFAPKGRTEVALQQLERWRAAGR